jgi:hypothetical protein
MRSNLGWATYHQVIVQGLQNKPKLKTLTLSETLSVAMFFDFIDDSGTVMYKPGTEKYLNPEKDPPADFLKLPHLACFLNLERLLVGERGDGSGYNWYTYFTRYFMDPQLLPNLKMFKIGDKDMLSRYSPEERR